MVRIALFGCGEEPIDLDLARVDECRAAIADADTAVMVGFNRRFDPTFADIRARVQAGEVGSLEPSPGFDDGRGALVLAEAANESLRTGSVVTIDGVA